MHNAGAFDTANSGEAVTTVCDQSVDEGSIFVTRTRMHNEAHWLVDDDEVTIFIQYHQRNALGSRFCFNSGRNGEAHALTRFHTEIGVLHNGGIDTHHSLRDQGLQTGAAHRGDCPAKNAVEAAGSFGYKVYRFWEQHVNSDTTSGETFQPTVAQKRLLRLVKGLGALMLVLLTGLVGGIVWKSMQPSVPATAQSLAMGLGLAASDIRQIDADGGTVAIVTGTELIVIDAARKKVLLREPLK